nr:X-Pro dipeptidyl-peptidase [Gemmatimonadales bacterium]
MAAFRLARLALMLFVGAVLTAPTLSAQQPDAALDKLFTRREVMIPMRDGVKLFTVILTPRAMSGPLPVLMSRTPYGT